MPLEPHQAKIFDHHLRAKINKNLECIVCGQSDWLPGELKGIPIIEIESRKTAKDVGLAPHVSITCANCGYVMLFSAQVVGLVGVGPTPSVN
jgi:predicted nucleic-acid-binding Zn-ribbon protein